MLYRVLCHTSALYTIHCCLQPMLYRVQYHTSALYYTLTLFTARCCTRYRAIPQHFTIYCCLQPNVVQSTVPYLSTSVYIVVYSQMLYKVPCHTSALYYILLFTARCCTEYCAIPQHFSIHCCLQPDVVQGTVPYLSTLLYIVVYSQMLYRVPCHTSALYTIHCCL